MKVLQINVVYKKGSTGKIVHDIHTNLLNNKIQSMVCYGRGEGNYEPHVYKIAPEWIMKIQSINSRITGYAYSGCTISTRKLIKFIDEEKPNIIHLHCLNGYFVNIYKLLNYLKLKNIKTILTLHAEFMYTAGCGYAYDCEQWKIGCCINGESCPGYNTLRPRSWIFNKCSKEWNMMKETFSGFDNLILCPVSDWVKDRAKQSPFLQDKQFITITNGVDNNIFKVRECDYLRQKHGIKDEKVILHVTPNFKSEIKGGKYVLEIANRLKNENIRIIIVGFNGDRSQLPANVISLEHTSDQEELAAYYSMADITLLTSKKETFSMICAESLCCGTPVVGFEAGAPETISIKKFSQFVEFGNLDKLEEVVRLWLYTKDIPGKEISNKAKKIYSKDIMYNKYFNIYKDVNQC